jgi:hypothetical protein
MAYNGDRWGSMTSTLVVVTSSLSPSTVLTENLYRTGLYVYNGSSQTVYLKLGTGVSSGSLTTKLTPSSSYSDDRARPYAGAVSVLWEAAAFGTLFITELS